MRIAVLAALFVCASSLPEGPRHILPGSGYAPARRSYASGAPAPAPAAKTVVAKVKLTGISVAQFDKTTKENFKTVVAKGASEVCGADGKSKCTAADVTITSVSAVRRSGINVEFFVKTTSKSKGLGDGTAALNTFLADKTKFMSRLTAKGGNLAKVTGTDVISAPALKVPPAPSPPAPPPAAGPSPPAGKCDSWLNGKKMGTLVCKNDKGVAKMCQTTQTIDAKKKVTFASACDLADACVARMPTGDIRQVKDTIGNTQCKVYTTKAGYGVKLYCSLTTPPNGMIPKGTKCDPFEAQAEGSVMGSAPATAMPTMLAVAATVVALFQVHH